MALISLPYTFSVGNTIIASQHNSNFSTIYNDYNGNITTSNIASNASIAYSQLSLSNSIKRSDLISTFNTSSGVGVIPSGGIIMWSGTIASIPSGWFLCNGSNGTPDLRNMFIVGADADSGGVAKSTVTGSALQTGGEATHVLTTTEMPSHTHSTGFSQSVQSGSNTNCLTGSGGAVNITTTSAGSGGAHNNIPPFYALALIMKS